METMKESPTTCVASPGPGCSVSEYPLWAVMLGHIFEKSMKGPLGIPVHAPKEGPHGFIPLFFTREQAVAWAGGDEHIAELTPNPGLHRMAHGQEKESGI